MTRGRRKEPLVASTNSFGAHGSLQVGDQDYEIYRINTVAGHETLPYSLKVLLENLLRTEDGANITADHIRALGGWDENAEPDTEIQFTPAVARGTSRTSPSFVSSSSIPSRRSIWRRNWPSTRRRPKSSGARKSRAIRVPGTGSLRVTISTPSSAPSRDCCWWRVRRRRRRRSAISPSTTSNRRH